MLEKRFYSFSVVYYEITYTREHFKGEIDLIIETLSWGILEVNEEQLYHFSKGIMVSMMRLILHCYLWTILPSGICSR